MIAVIDSGSTKSDWVLSEHSNRIYIQTQTSGLNPYFHNSESIVNEIRQNEILSKQANLVTELFFYGTGCSSDAASHVVKTGLERVFSHAQITVNHDVLGSAIATYENKTAISCILGTGTNTCIFDGNQLKGGVPSLGFILGDEASGTWFGKHLLQDYFYKRMPAHIAVAFNSSYQLDKDDVLHNTYRCDSPNRYLAQYTKFLSEQIQEEYVQELLSKGFRTFFETHILSYPEAHALPVNFVGSIAFYFKEKLIAVGKEYDLNIQKIVRKPIEELHRFHSRTSRA